MIVRDARTSGRHGGLTGESTITVADLLARRTAPRVPRQRSGSSESGSSDSGSASSGPSGSSSRHRRASRRPLVVAAVGLVAAAGATVAVWQAAGPDSALTAAAAPAGPAVLRLTTPQVGLGNTYLATASGFTPGEPVRLSWTGPTRGEMGTYPADGAGRVLHGPVIERDPPGDYRIIATGLTSGHTAVTPLRVAPAAQGR